MVGLPWLFVLRYIFFAAYIKEFHPSMIGLTGTPKQIIDLAKAYRVYVSKAGSDEDYLVDHSIILYPNSVVPMTLKGPHKLCYTYHSNRHRALIINKIFNGPRRKIHIIFWKNS